MSRAVVAVTVTFQLFVLFAAAGTSGEQMIGAMVGKVVGIVPLLVAAGCIVAGAVAVYALALAPRLKEA